MANATPDTPVVDPAAIQQPAQPQQSPPEPPAAPAAQTYEDELADIESPVEPRTWIFEGNFNVRRGDEFLPQEFKGEYEQLPLSYFGFLEFTGLIAKKIDEAMSGDDGLTIREMIETTQSAVPFIVDGANVEAAIEENKLEGVDAFVQGLMKLASYVPDVIEECQFIWLRVPRRDRPFLREIWAKPMDKGGLSPTEGEEMMSLFIEQNFQELEDFFFERLPRLAQTVNRVRAKSKKRGGNIGRRLSRPLSPTAETTQSQ